MKPSLEETAEKLKQREAELAEAQRLAHVGSWSWEIATNTVTWSDELYRIFGLRPQEFPATLEGFLKSIHPEDRERTRLAVEEALRTRQPYADTRRVVRSDGEIRIVEAHGSVVCDGSGEPVRLFGTSQDITEREHAAAALRAAHQKYRDILDNLQEGVFQTTPEGSFITVNRALVKMLGFASEQELIEMRRDIASQHYVNPADREELARQLNEFGKVSAFEFEAYRKDGTRIWLSENVRAVRADDGSIVFYEGTAQDITARKQAQEALRESEERYRELFENSRDAIYVHDLNGRYTSVNRAAEELSGYTRDEILGKHYSNFVLPTHLKTVRENFCRKLDVPLATTYETQIVCKDRSRKPVEVSSRMIYQNGKPAGVQGTVRDITEQKRAQLALQTYSRRLVNAQEAERENIARELHDEIGQALTAISINLAWIDRSGAVQESAIPRLRESMTVIDDALRRVRELSFELRPLLLDDLGLVAALTWYATRFSERTGIRTEVSGDLTTGGISRSIETTCFRIAQEALTNTARHSRATRATINIDRGTSGSLKLTISDNGVGFRVGAHLNSGSRALGLRGMLERARAVSGHVKINSEPGEGTEVVLAVPLLPAK